MAVTAALAGAGQAQVVEKKALTLEGARQIIATAIGEARRLKAPGGIIAVVDDGGNLMALERLDGTFAAGANISIGKARTAAILAATPMPRSPRWRGSSRSSATTSASAPWALPAARWSSPPTSTRPIAACRLTR